MVVTGGLLEYSALLNPPIDLRSTDGLTFIAFNQCLMGRGININGGSSKLLAGPLPEGPDAPSKRFSQMKHGSQQTASEKCSQREQPKEICRKVQSGKCLGGSSGEREGPLERERRSIGEREMVQWKIDIAKWKEKMDECMIMDGWMKG